MTNKTMNAELRNRAVEAVNNYRARNNAEWPSVSTLCRIAHIASPNYALELMRDMGRPRVPGMENRGRKPKSAPSK